MGERVWLIYCKVIILVASVIMLVSMVRIADHFHV